MEFSEKDYVRGKYSRIILSNDKYIRWLCDFSLKHNNFTDDEWGFNVEDIPKKDRENARYLGLLFSCIKDFADDNCICPIIDDEITFYRVFYDGNCLEIGFKGGNGTYYFCNRIQCGDNLDFIDFNDILIGKRLDDKQKYDGILWAFSQIIKNISARGVPPELIESTVKKVLDEIEKDQDKGFAYRKK